MLLLSLVAVLVVGPTYLLEFRYRAEDTLAAASWALVAYLGIRIATVVVMGVWVVLVALRIVGTCVFVRHPGYQCR